MLGTCLMRRVSISNICRLNYWGLFSQFSFQHNTGLSPGQSVLLLNVKHSTLWRAGWKLSRLVKVGASFKHLFNTVECSWRKNSCDFSLIQFILGMQITCRYVARRQLYHIRGQPSKCPSSLLNMLPTAIEVVGLYLK